MGITKSRLGEIIFDLRNERTRPKMTRERLAHLVEVDQATIYRWETGKSWPELDKIESLARVLEVKIAYLFDQRDDLSLSEKQMIDTMGVLRSEKRKAELRAEQLDLKVKRLESDIKAIEVDSELQESWAKLASPEEDKDKNKPK